MNAPLPAHVAAWLEQAMPEGTDTPCGHYTAATDSVCGAAPTRAYISGRRCITHAPDQQNNTKEN